ncbi:hypothetical protein A2291_01470 [candidate division WOR-1 bacterium RIFOXYB2_FULL_42_35]|nr:MAG: hypothetical protein A2247_00790 [candidate division WOR-1 bacterium RIFOXYA2_FULL_41_14]OGC21514.1 MAG: hypothetical protein A2291_01470 [candidate division WOR-1 bacterium RIFOXYB2_FULL_42_35]
MAIILYVNNRHITSGWHRINRSDAKKYGRQVAQALGAQQIGNTTNSRFHGYAHLEQLEHNPDIDAAVENLKALGVGAVEVTSSGSEVRFVQGHLYNRDRRDLSLWTTDALAVVDCTPHHRDLFGTPRVTILGWKNREGFFPLRHYVEEYITAGQSASLMPATIPLTGYFPVAENAQVSSFNTTLMPRPGGYESFYAGPPLMRDTASGELTEIEGELDIILAAARNIRNGKHSMAIQNRSLPNSYGNMLAGGSVLGTDINGIKRGWDLVYEQGLVIQSHLSAEAQEQYDPFMCFNGTTLVVDVFGKPMLGNRWLLDATTPGEGSLTPPLILFARPIDRPADNAEEAPHSSLVAKVLVDPITGRIKYPMSQKTWAKVEDNLGVKRAAKFAHRITGLELRDSLLEVADKRVRPNAEQAELDNLEKEEAELTSLQDTEKRTDIQIIRLRELEESQDSRRSRMEKLEEPFITEAERAELITCAKTIKQKDLATEYRYMEVLPGFLGHKKFTGRLDIMLRFLRRQYYNLYGFEQTKALRQNDDLLNMAFILLALTSSDRGFDIAGFVNKVAPGAKEVLVLDFLQEFYEMVRGSGRYKARGLFSYVKVAPTDLPSLQVRANQPLTIGGVRPQVDVAAELRKRGFLCPDNTILPKFTTDKDKFRKLFKQKKTELEDDQIDKIHAALIKVLEAEDRHIDEKIHALDLGKTSDVIPLTDHTNPAGQLVPGDAVLTGLIEAAISPNHRENFDNWAKARTFLGIPLYDRVVHRSLFGTEEVASGPGTWQRLKSSQYLGRKKLSPRTWGEMRRDGTQFVLDSHLSGSVDQVGPAYAVAARLSATQYVRNVGPLIVFWSDLSVADSITSPGAGGRVGLYAAHFDNRTWGHGAIEIKGGSSVFTLPLRGDLAGSGDYRPTLSIKRGYPVPPEKAAPLSPGEAQARRDNLAKYRPQVDRATAARHEYDLLERILTANNGVTNTDRLRHSVRGGRRGG